jgi:hypothetical protein
MDEVATAAVFHAGRRESNPEPTEDVRSTARGSAARRPGHERRQERSDARSERQLRLR